MKICVFDYDDTLMMTRECKTQALVFLGKELFDLSISENKIEEHWGIAHHKLFEKLFEISGNKLEMAMKFYEGLDSKYPLVPHTDALISLGKLQDEFDLVIVSSCTKKLINLQLSNSTLSNINFDCIFGAEDSQFHKPSGKVFAPLFDKYPNIDKSELVYIGDGYKDMLAAKDAGLWFIGIDRSSKETNNILNDNGVIIPSLADLPKQLLGS